MATFQTSQVSLSYPKARDILTKVIPIARTDSSTAKCVLPKDAVVCGIFVHQQAAAVTGAASYNLGWSGNTTALLNAFSLPTTSVGYAAGGATTGASVLTKLDSDKAVIGTFTVGTSSAGGTGYIVIQYFMPGGQEGVDD